MRITERDINVMRWIEKLKYISTSLIINFFFDGNPKVARRRLRLLCKEGYVYWFEKNDNKSCGRLERVWYLNKKKKDELKYLLGISDLHFYQLPMNPLFVNHHLRINEFILCLQKACISSKKYSFESIVENENYSIGKNFVPDCLIVLKREAKALFYIEIDMGTQTLTTVSQKITAYMEHLQTGNYKALSKEFNYDFKGFRMLMVTESQLRLNRLSTLCEETGTRGNVFLSTFDKIKPETILHEDIWNVPCSKKQGLQSLVKKQ